MSHEERKQVWVDPFQTRLVWRIAAYLAVFLVVLANFLFLWKVATEGVGKPLEQWLALLRGYLPVGICLLILVPIMAWDAIRFSHRLTGPLVRFRQAMQSITRGEMVRPIKLREGDYLDEMRDDFNAMLDALQQRGAAVLQPDVSRADQKSRKQPV